MVIFLGRRVFFIVLMFAIPDYPAIQIFLFTESIIIYIIYLMNIKPYESKSLMLQEFINEIFFLLINYHILLFTDIVSSIEM